ncbi:MAG: DUF4340 domain-containing protein [Halobacteriovoraceae bacterium]|jgi:hypothetical protein|nr:DUF4340 domain-containing protein [Halobacteriovoraceae bacterium]MBT5094323.1 DUF4340 domain-containing protein [Halobacteriovoraceae bacterium]
MALKLNRNKSVLSSWLLAFFTLAMIISAGISTIFQAPKGDKHDLNRYRTLFQGNFLEGIRGIYLKNRLGEFEFLKNSGARESGWELLTPRNFPANPKAVARILDSLKNIKIRKIYQKDPINMANFSLDSPLLSLRLSLENGESIELEVGLVNPIDNSTYLMSSHQNAIYHVDALQFAMESLDLADLIDSKIFSIEPENIASLKIYRGAKRGNPPHLLLTKLNGQWGGKKNHPMPNAKVFKYLKKLASLKSTFILDKASEDLTKKLNKYLSTPLYTIEIEDLEKNSFTYNISTVINALPQIKMEKRTNFIIQASDRRYPYLVNKEYLRTFNKTEKAIKR